MKEEIWKPIENTSNFYWISSYGRVWSNKRNRILKTRIDKGGYPTISLRINNKVKTLKIHRLVAIAFIPNPYDLPCVNHKDEKSNNAHIDNLEWCTMKYNNTYGTKQKRTSETLKGKYTGENHPFYGKHHSAESINKMKESRKGKAMGKDNKKSIPVICDNIKFETISSCADYYNINIPTMYRWLTKERKMPQEFKDLGLNYYNEEEVNE